MTIWFEYKYITLNEIIKNMKLISTFNILDFIILFSLVFLIIVLIFYIFPLSSMLLEERKKKKIKEEKRKMIKQILLWKEIESEIEEDLKKYDLSKKR